MDKLEFLGVGLKFPVEILNGKPQTESGIPLLIQSISEYLNTQKGTRFFLNECGSRVQEYLFEPNDEYLQDMIQLRIQECIDRWEKRVIFEGVAFEAEKDVLKCLITCSVSGTDLQFTFVYPYYRKLEY